MNTDKSSSGIQTERDTRANNITETDKFAKISEIKPLNFLPV